MNENAQNACLTTTILDEETGKMMLTYVPLRITQDLLDKLLDNSTCDNKRGFQFELLISSEEYWGDMWKSLEGMCDVDE